MEKKAPQKTGFFGLQKSEPEIIFTKAGTSFDEVLPYDVVNLPLDWYCMPLRVDVSVVKKDQRDSFKDDTN